MAIEHIPVKQLAKTKGLGDLIDNELPSQKTCLRVQQNYAFKGTWRHLNWECFGNQADEEAYLQHYRGATF